MDRKNFIKSVGLLTLGSLILVGCDSHKDKKRQKFTVIPKRCKGCGDCLKACDEHALSSRGKIAYIDQSRCKGCGDCAERCDKMAIVPLNDSQIVRNAE